jgi:EpsI family protein
MAKDSKYYRRQVIAAAATASAMILLYGWGYRVLAARLEAPVNTAPISQEALDRLPMQIGQWRGHEVPLGENVVRATDTDAHLSRRYAEHGAAENIWLYVAYGVRARDLQPHRPEVCYTGAGWTLKDQRSVVLTLKDGTTLPCNFMGFSRGLLGKEKVAVLYYYIVDGEYCGDVSLLRSKAWSGSGTVGYVAQVQILAAVASDLDADSAMEIVSNFATESASLIAQLFERAEDNRDAD